MGFAQSEKVITIMWIPSHQGRLRAQDGNREMITVLEGIYADGTSLEPLIITKGKRQWKTFTQVLEEDVILRERADAVARAIGYYPPESGRHSGGRPFGIGVEDLPSRPQATGSNPLLPV